MPAVIALVLAGGILLYDAWLKRTRFGPLGRVLEDADETTRIRVLEAVRAAFEPFVHGAEVRYVAACWMVSAKAP